MPKPIQTQVDGPCPFDAPYCGGHIHHCRLCSRYAVGIGPPNFPMPVLPDTAMLSLWCQKEINVWHIWFMKQKLHNRSVFKEG